VKAWRNGAIKSHYYNKHQALTRLTGLNQPPLTIGITLGSEGLMEPRDVPPLQKMERREWRERMDREREGRGLPEHRLGR
jgi:hypothetical protein